LTRPVALQERAGVAIVQTARCGAFYGHLIDAVDGYDEYGGWAIPFRNDAGEELVLKRAAVVSRHLCAEDSLIARAHKAAGQGHTHQRATSRCLLRPRQITPFLFLLCHEWYIVQLVPTWFKMLLCRGNSARSIFGEFLLRRAGSDAVARVNSSVIRSIRKLR
jgi:hypothetical protein